MKFLLTLFIFISLNTFAETPIAEVVKIRGTVTQLSPHDKEAKNVKLGDKLIEDTSILTNKLSFVKIKFIDNSELNVGPESKIVITEMKKDAPGIVSLLKGRIRTEVEKDAKQNDNKFYIRTRTAAMGVRGTDFQTIYNPDSQTTSLLTFKGEVAMAKVNIENLSASEVDASFLKNKLATSETVLVPPGQTSFTSDAIVKSSLPVKISPLQLTALYKNQEFLSKSEKPSAEPTKLDELKIADQKVPAEGLLNKKNGDFAPKSGGFIDLETGIYVAPDSTATLDKKTGVYASNKIGTVDTQTGEYVPPKGLALDPKKGFVIDKQHANTENKDLLALTNDLNKRVMTDAVQVAVVVKPPEKKVIPKMSHKTKIEEVAIEKPYKINEKFSKDQFSVAFKLQSQDISLNENSASRPSTKHTYGDFKTISLSTETSSINRYRALFSFDYSQNRSKEGPGSLFAFSSGGKYALTKNYDLFSKIGLFQEQFLIQSSANYPTKYELTRIVLTRLSLGAQAQFILDEEDGFSIVGSVEALGTFRKRLNGTVIQNGWGTIVNIAPKLTLGESHWILLGFSYSVQKQNVENIYGVDKQKKNISGLDLKLVLEN